MYLLISIKTRQPRMPPLAGFLRKLEAVLHQASNCFA